MATSVWILNVLTYIYICNLTKIDTKYNSLAYQRNYACMNNMQTTDNSTNITLRYMLVSKVPLTHAYFDQTQAHTGWKCNTARTGRQTYRQKKHADNKRYSEGSKEGMVKP